MWKKIKKLFKGNTTKMSFKEGLDLTNLPIVTFYINNDKYNFILDTGANKSMIDSRYLDKIHYTPIKEKCKYFGVDGNIVESIYAGIIFTYRNHEFKDIMQVADLAQAFDNIKRIDGVTVHGIIGNEFMQRYKYVLDFNEWIAYSKA